MKKRPDWILTCDEGVDAKQVVLLKALTETYVACLDAGLRPRFHVLEPLGKRKSNGIWGSAWRDFMKSDNRRGPLILGNR